MDLEFCRQMSTKYFYKDLPYLENILESTDLSLYKDVPIDWHVVVTDIKGSTVAIEEGRFKEVNFVSAATITAVLNIDKYTDLPFTFGGDGGTILIPPEFVNKVKSVLADTQRFCRREFGFHLRTAIIPVIDILREKRTIKVLKLKVASNYYQAIFNGEGLHYAEYLAKKDPKYSVVVKNIPFRANFSGIECIWQNIPSKSEEVVSLLIKPLVKDEYQKQVYNNVLRAIREIYGEREVRFPVSQDSIRIKTNLTKINLEARILAYQYNQSRSLLALQIFAKNLFSGLVYKLNLLIKIITFKPKKKIIIDAVDSEKLDDMLRMVITGTKAQRYKLRSYLEDKYRKGYLAYGIYVSDSVELTCVIFSRKGKQVYFMDGSNGGYSYAAKELKNKIKWYQWKAESII